MKIVCISDTHCQLDKISIPDGDVLVLAGDITFNGSIQQISKELFELSKHRNRFKSIILVEGNHDWLGQRNPAFMEQLCKDNGITLLKDSGISIDGVNFWRSPWQKEFYNWAYNLPPGEELKKKWDLIPLDTDVLVTHSPPHGVLDQVQSGDPSLGCEDLRNKIFNELKLKTSIFGHIHGGHGQIKIGETTFVNASICTEQYKPNNLPIVIEV